MNERDMRTMYDGRRLPPRNARGEFKSRGRSRGRRGDRGMYPEMHGDGRVIRSYPTMHPQGDYRGDMTYDMARHEDVRHTDYRSGDYRGRQMMGDGHYMHGRQSGYEPVEFMGYCQGYYGSPNQDYGYTDMRGRRDYGYDYGDDYGDYGQTLSEKELDEWCHKLKSHLDEREKQMFHKDAIAQKASQIGREMHGFGEKELEVVTLMLFDDYKHTLGANPDIMVKLAFDWLDDKDAKLKGAEKLAVYYDEIVMGDED